MLIPSLPPSFLPCVSFSLELRVAELYRVRDRIIINNNRIQRSSLTVRALNRGFKEEGKEHSLTVDVEGHALGDGWWHVVGGDAHVSGHRVTIDAVQAQHRTVERFHFYTKRRQQNNICHYTIANCNCDHQRRNKNSRAPFIRSR